MSLAVGRAVEGNQYGQHNLEVLQKSAASASLAASTQGCRIQIVEHWPRSQFNSVPKDNGNPPLPPQRDPRQHLRSQRFLCPLPSFPHPLPLHWDHERLCRIALEALFAGSTLYVRSKLDEGHCRLLVENTAILPLFTITPPGTMAPWTGKDRRRERTKVCTQDMRVWGSVIG
ncbi:hypothetical protein DOTSEDRAFT_73638 [Dothistroma septosporum NZE10]|uniref:Uncharacterized protein n=1 Tax=Dothistroma septosporum (strain NZE10 / CBS 128990) TaxID=675120 RepID=N1PG00_DOTSN|nr:hypothetical protein DOTSEDRAFT_73638 [Dothistroma septosporum NZE10]